MKSIILTTVVLLNFLLFSCSPKAQTSEQTKSTTKTTLANPVVLLQPAEFKKMIESGDIQLVDIRTPGEYAQGHMEGALNYDYYKRDFMQKMLTLDKSKPVFIYCRSGNRTGSTDKKLKRSGFTKIYDLAGGINNWLRKGYKLKR